MVKDNTAEQVGFLKKDDGYLPTDTLKENLQVLIETHYPGSSILARSEWLESHREGPSRPITEDCRLVT